MTDAISAVEGWSTSAPATARPLNDAEFSAAGQVSARLHAELRGVVGLLPPDQRGASAMSRVLQIDRATCQRIVSALSAREAGPDTLIQLPGVLGLRQFLDAVRQRGLANTEQVATALAAVARFEGFLEEVAGSQRRLRERLLAREALGGGRETYVGSDDRAVRESLNEAAARATGRWTESMICLRIARPVPGSARLTEEALVRGLIGHTARAQAVPLVIGLSTSHPASGDAMLPHAALDSRPASGACPSVLVSEFCTTPLPDIVSRNAGNRVVHMIDAPAGVSGRAMDIVVAHREIKPEPHPATARPPIGEMWTLVTFPARRLVFDVYLHRDLARACVASLESHLWNPDVGQQGASRWATRFPGGPELRTLGPGLGASGTGVYPRMRELTEHVFARVGWDPEGFVGYRCEVTHPLWRAGYCMVFDFSGNEMEHAAP